QDDAGLAGLGPGLRDGAPREGFPGHGHAGLLRRPPLALATTQQREHEPALPRVPPQGHRDPRSPALPHHHRRGDQQPTPTPTRLPDTDRILRPTTGRRTPCCFHALTPPWRDGVNRCCAGDAFAGVTVLDHAHGKVTQLWTELLGHVPILLAETRNETQGVSAENPGRFKLRNMSVNQG